MSFSAERAVFPQRPVLRYHGGKWLLAPWIISFFPAHETYVEPFGGAASVLLRKPPSANEIYNDLDADVANLFSVLRGAEASELVRQLQLTPFSRIEWEQAYQHCDDTLERARRLVVRSYMGFSSAGSSVEHQTGFRYKPVGSRVTPARDWAAYPESLATVCARLQGVVVENRSAFELIPALDSPRTLFYVDPPYLLDTRVTEARRNPCYRHELTDNEHRRLLLLLRGVRGYVVLSGYAHPLYEELLHDWVREDRSHIADSGGPRLESVWLNPACAAQQSQLRLPGFDAT